MSISSFNFWFSLYKVYLPSCDRISCTYAHSTKLVPLTITQHAQDELRDELLFSLLECHLFLFSLWWILLPYIRDPTQLYLLCKAFQIPPEQMNYMQSEHYPCTSAVCTVLAFNRVLGISRRVGVTIMLIFFNVW